MKTIFYNGAIFTGDEFIYGKSLVAEGRSILGFENVEEAQGERLDLESGYLVPAFIDLQLYGGNGKLFGEHPSVESLKATLEYSIRGGATNILPTVATNSMEVMLQAIEAIRSYQQKGLEGILGLHLEGPYISLQRRGAHIEKFIKPPSLGEVRELISKGEGVIRMITLAPEVCSKEVIEYLKENQVYISAGHSDASYQVATEAFNGGVNLVTHLFNAMSPLHHRAGGMVGATLNHEGVMASIVADGNHVDFPIIQLAKKVMGDRLFLITDAVTTNKEGYYKHQLKENKYVVEDGTLSGSALTMLKAVSNCINKVGLTIEESIRMASLYPARAIGLDKRLGRIKKGFEAELLLLDKQFNLVAIYSRGSLFRL